MLLVSLDLLQWCVNQVGPGCCRVGNNCPWDALVTCPDLHGSIIRELWQRSGLMVLVIASFLLSLELTVLFEFIDVWPLGDELLLQLW